MHAWRIKLIHPMHKSEARFELFYGVPWVNRTSFLWGWSSMPRPWLLAAPSTLYPADIEGSDLLLYQLDKHSLRPYKILLLGDPFVNGHLLGWSGTGKLFPDGTNTITPGPIDWESTFIW